MTALFNLVLTGAVVATVGMWGVILAGAWGRSRNHPSQMGISGGGSRNIIILLWSIIVASSLVSILKSLGFLSFATSLSVLCNVVFPVAVLAGAMGSLRTRSVSSARLIPTWLLLFSAAQIAASVVNGQLQLISPLLLTGLVYLPGLTIILWKSDASRDAIRHAVMNISLTVVWASLVFSAVDLRHAEGDLPRRVLIGTLEHRLAGVTPHPNLLALTAAIGLLLIIRAKPKMWVLHLAAIGAILVMAEARTLTLALAFALLAYWIVAGRAARFIRALGGLLVALPLTIALWASGSASFGATDLGGDVATFNSRTDVWALVGQYWSQKPLMGWGPFAFNDDTSSPLSTLFFNNAHNQLLEALAEAGILGLAAMLTVLAGIVFAAIRYRDPVFTAVAAMALIFMMTEVPLTFHDYGFSFTVGVGALLLAILVPGPQADIAGRPEQIALSGRRRSGHNRLALLSSNRAGPLSRSRSPLPPPNLPFQLLTPTAPT